MKCWGPNKCMDDFKLSMSVTFTPSGGAISVLASVIIPMFTELPTTKPTMTARIIFMIGLFIIASKTLKDTQN